VTLGDYYFGDSRLFLIPIEHLAPSGMSREHAAVLRERGLWSAAQIELFDRAFALYWSRSLELAKRTRTWMPPRIRHIAVVTNAQGVRPYAQLLNTSAWTVYSGDFDPQSSHPEFGAYVLAHGDRMALSGEVTLSALHNAAWWLERDDAECAAFAAAAGRSTRPDASGFRAVANALPWLRRLRHETLAPPLATSPHRAIPGTVCRAAGARGRAAPSRRCVDGGREEAIDSTGRRGGASDRALGDLAEWLARDVPPLLVTERGRVVWDPEHPERVGALRTAQARRRGGRCRHR
jgi:hypothetical protein